MWHAPCLPSRVTLTSEAPVTMLATALRRTTLATTLVFTAGCDADWYTPRGRYDLSAVNGRSVPAAVYTSLFGSSLSKVEVVSGTLSINRGDSWQMVLEVRETTGDRVVQGTRAFGGRWEREDRIVWLGYFEPGSAFEQTIAGQWRGGRLELIVPGVQPGSGALCTFDRR